jgi:hypothetical protein
MAVVLGSVILGGYADLTCGRHDSLKVLDVVILELEIGSKSDALLKACKHCVLSPERIFPEQQIKPACK